MTPSTRTFIRPFFALAAALVCLITTQNIQAAEPAVGGTATAGNMMEQCKEMQIHKQQVMADMKAQDTALSEQVAQMNNATDSKKLGLLAALVTRMAEQRMAMNAHMATIGDMKMKHMTQHMQKGRESMQGCAMMMGKDANDMKGMDDKAEEPEKGLKP